MTLRDARHLLYEYNLLIENNELDEEEELVIISEIERLAFIIRSHLKNRSDLLLIK